MAKYPAEIYEAVISAYSAGFDGPRVSEMVGIPSNTVDGILRRSGIPARRGSYPDWVTEYVLSAYGAGFSKTETANMLGTSTTPVYRILREHHCPSRWWSKKPPASYLKSAPWREPNGYMYVSLHPRHQFYAYAQAAARKTSGPGNNEQYRRRCALHRLVVMESSGRGLRRDEQVHHIDGDKTNNHIDNLQLREGPHGSGQVWVCANCGCDARKAVPLDA